MVMLWVKPETLQYLVITWASEEIFPLTSFPNFSKLCYIDVDFYLLRYSVVSLHLEPDLKIFIFIVKPYNK